METKELETQEMGEIKFTPIMSRKTGKAEMPKNENNKSFAKGLLQCIAIVGCTSLIPMFTLAFMYLLPDFI